MEAGLRMSRSSGCCERQAQERQRAICAVAMGISHPGPSTTHERSYGVQPLKPGLDRLLWDWRIDWDRRHLQRIKEANHSTRRNHSKTKPI